MPGFVKFYGAPAENAYIVSGDSLQEFRRGPKSKTRVGSRYRWGYEKCSRVAQTLREAGNPTVRAYNENGLLLGGEPAEPSSAPAQAQAATYTSAQARDGSYRQIPPIRKTHAGFFLDYHVFHEGAWQSGAVQGRTPNECVEKLFQTGASVYEAFIQTLPIVDAPAVETQAAVDLNTVQIMSEREYSLIPSAEFRPGGRYYTDAVFKARVDGLIEQRKANAAARRASVETSGL